MRKQLDMEKLIQEVMGFSPREDKTIDKAGMDLLHTMQRHLDLVREYLRGDISREDAEPKIKMVLAEIARLQTENEYWWLEK